MSIFSKVPVQKPSLNTFDLSHSRKLSCNMGELIPVFAHESMPGDRFRVSTEGMLRYAPMLAPVLHDNDVTFHWFSVPFRLCWNEWEDHVTGGRLGTANPAYPVIPISNASLNSSTGYAQAGLIEEGSLLDHIFGLLLTDSNTVPVNDPTNISAIYPRAYQLIYDEYYRDQNLEASLDVSITSGELSIPECRKVLTKRKRAWAKEYFSSALPFTQRGPEALIPMVGEGTVDYFPSSQFLKFDTGAPASNGAVTMGTDGTTIGHILDSTGKATRVENISAVNVENTTVTINDLRKAVSLQKFLEKMARGGGRYIEQIFSMFGVISSDARLQRPEYLGGSKQPVVISEVLSSFQADGGTIPQGNMAGHGISVGHGNGFSHRFEEHCVIMCIMSIMPKVAYNTVAIPKLARIFDRLELPWPDFAHLGEQAIQLMELWYDQSAPAGQHLDTFGYTPRYAHYKYIPSTVHGNMRTTLNYWHENREFEDKPVLNQSFVTADPTLRIFNIIDPSIDHVYVMIWFHVKAMRPLPYFGVGALIG